MCGMRPIETVWHGIRFRSRLEARWAIALECLGADWEYEPDGFAFEDGTTYLPDFLLHGVALDGVARDVYVEAKGRMQARSMRKCELFAESMPLYVVGSVPFERGPYSVEVLRRPYMGVKRGYAYYSSLFVDGQDEPLMLCAGDGALLARDGDSFDAQTTSLAYRVASSARFDHMERPSDAQITECRTRAIGG